MAVNLYIFNSKILMKKFVSYLFFVLVGVISVDALFSFCMEKVAFKVIPPIIGETNDSTSDIVIIGASRATRHYNSFLLSDSLHCSVSVLGAASQNIYFHYATLNILLNHTKKSPNMVLLEVAPVDVYDFPNHNKEKLSFLFPYFNTETAVKKLLTDVLEKKELLMIYSGLYRYNSRVFPYIGNAMRGKQESVVVGFLPLKNVWKAPIKEEDNYGRIDTAKIRYFDKFVDICMREKIKLVFVSSPSYKVLHRQIWKEKIRMIAQEHQIPFIDYEQDSTFLEHREWFYDPYHLNEIGANVYSILIAKDLKRIIAQKDN